MQDLFKSIAEHPPVLLMVGDLLNLAGGIWLATDLIAKEHELHRHHLYLKVLAKPHDFPIEVDGQQVRGVEDIEVVFVRRKARSAIYACGLMVLGFALLSVGHWLEVRRG
jgi:hypothetical protein